MCPNQPAKGTRSFTVRLSEADADRLQQIRFEFGYPTDADALRHLVRESDPAYLYHHKTKKKRESNGH
jgi:hypothetical protein